MSGLIVRRVRRTSGTWHAVADNRRYRPIPWNESFEIVGKVVWTSHKVDTEAVASVCVTGW